MSLCACTSCRKKPKHATEGVRFCVDSRTGPAGVPGALDHCLISWAPPLSFDARSHSKWSFLLGWTDCVASSWDLPHTIALSFSKGAGSLVPGPHACTVGPLPTELSPQHHTCALFRRREGECTSVYLLRVEHQESSPYSAWVSEWVSVSLDSCTFSWALGSSFCSFVAFYCYLLEAGSFLMRDTGNGSG